MIAKKICIAILFSFILISADLVIAQQFSTPRSSPMAKLSQMVGVSEVTVVYSRPAVNGRKIWGELVPYNQMWRTGANENTTIELTHEAKINGEKIPAGKYGIQTIPGETEWTVIFSKDNNLSGSSGYKEENDALRIKVKPVTGEHAERLTFEFEKIGETNAELNLRWDKLSLPLEIEFDTPGIVKNNLNRSFSWGVPNTYATYLLTTGANNEEALKWVDLSISMNENYWNLRTKAQLLAKSGQKDAAVQTMEKAINIGEKMDNKPFDFDGMKKLLAEWKG
jgi:hypothetical protein